MNNITLLKTLRIVIAFLLLIMLWYPILPDTYNKVATSILLLLTLYLNNIVNQKNN